MNDLIAGAARLLLRLLLVAAGLLFAASLVLAVLVLLALWGLRALWARLTGRPVMPFVMRVNPRQGFERVWRAGPGARPAPGRGGSGGTISDVTDVEPKPPRD